MSEIKKSQRSESKLQTVHNAYKIRTAVTKLAENNFYFDLNKINEVINSACGINEHLRIANTIFPTYMSEFEERRLELDKAMSCCNVLQDELQYAGECLYADLNRFTSLVIEIQKEFNMIKKLRQTDNRFLKDIKQ